jgi:hypothetical protein
LEEKKHPQPKQEATNREATSLVARSAWRGEQTAATAFNGKNLNAMLKCLFAIGQTWRRYSHRELPGTKGFLRLLRKSEALDNKTLTGLGCFRLNYHAKRSNLSFGSFSVDFLHRASRRKLPQDGRSFCPHLL